MKKLNICIACFLCVALLLFVGVRPITARAEAITATIGALGATAKVAVGLLAVVVVLIGVGYVSDNIDEIVSESQRVYDSLSSSVKDWCADVYFQIIDGTSAFKIPSNVRKEFNEAMKDKDKTIPDNLPIVLFPDNFLSLDTLTQEDVFTDDIAGALEKQASILGAIKLKLSTSFDTINETLQNQYSGIVERVTALNANISNMSSAITGKINDYGQRIWAELGNVGTQIRTSVNAVRSDVGLLLSNLQSMSNSLQTDIGIVVNNIQSMSNSLQTDIGLLIDNVGAFLAPVQDGIDIIAEKIKSMSISLQTDIGLLIDNLKSMSISLQTDIGIVVDKMDGFLESISTTITNSYSSLREDIKEKATLIFPDISPDDNGTPINTALTDLENRLRDFAKTGLQQGKELLENAMAIFEEFAPAFAVVSAIFSLFTNIPFFTFIVSVSLSIGVSGMILGFANSVARSFAEKPASHRGGRSKGGKR